MATIAIIPIARNERIHKIHLPGFLVAEADMQAGWGNAPQSANLVAGQHLNHSAKDPAQIICS